MGKIVDFTTRNGEVKSGYIIRVYYAFEGGCRYIIRCDDGDYRCVLKDWKYVEYVA